MKTYMAAKDRDQAGFFYGYVIVGACFVIMAATFGLNYSFGVFFKPLINEFGWTRAGLSAAYSVMTLISGLIGILSGRLSDRFGPRIIGILSGVFLCIGFLLLSKIGALWHFYVVYGLVMAAGVGGPWPGLMPTVAKWFTLRRGLMTGIVATGIGFGTFLVPPLAEYLISHYDWRTAYLVIGIATLFFVVGFSLLLHSDPGKIGIRPYGESRPVAEADLSRERIGFREATGTLAFWILCVVYFCFGYCLHTIIVHIAPHAQDLGLSAADAARGFAVMGATSMITRILAGAASDRFGIKPSLIVGFAVLVISMVWVQVVQSVWMFYVFGILFGITYGTIMALQTPAAARLFGLHSLGIILGTITFSYTVGGALGPVVSGYIYDLIGGYRPAFILAVFIATIAFILSFTLNLRKGEDGD